MASIFRAAEIPARHGALDDETFDDGRDTGAEKCREIARDGNLHVARGHLMYRWFTRADPPVGGGEQGYGLTCAPPFWQTAVPMPPGGMPVDKKFGLTRARMRVRAEIEANRLVELHLATSIDASPAASSGPTLTMRGTGALEVYEVEDVPLRREAGELIMLSQRARVDVDNDPLLDTATYGGLDSGTTDSAPTLSTMRDSAGGWNATGNRVHQGGYYLITRDTSGALRMAPAEIRAVGPDEGGGITNELIFWPPAPDQRHLVPALYEIRKLPLVRYVSIAIYAQDRTP